MHTTTTPEPDKSVNDLPPSLRPFIRRIPTRKWTPPGSPHVIVEYVREDDGGVEIIAIEVRGQILSGDTLAFFKRYGFDQDELHDALVELK